MAEDELLYQLSSPHGVGEVFFSWQPKSGRFLATAGADQTVSIFSREGAAVDKINLSGSCIDLCWDPEGDMLGIIAQGSHDIILWDSNRQKKQYVDSGLRETLSCLAWAKKDWILAVGSIKGNICIYNHLTAKRLPCFAKHSKRITTAAWNSENILGFGSEDCTISLNNIQGDSLHVITVRAEPSNLRFLEHSVNSKFGGESMGGVVIGGKNLSLFSIKDPSNLMELMFQTRYGSIVDYHW
nr:PREDICTED: WD repeat-containing protein 19-like [Bemisia tabaci]